MVKITLDIEGMACGMCEAHVNDAVRRVFPVKKVTSSHSKGNHCGNADRRKQPEECNRGNRIQGACRTY